MNPQASKPDREVERLLDLARTMNGLGETLEKLEQGNEAVARTSREEGSRSRGSAEGLADNLVCTAQIRIETSGMAMVVEET